MDYLKRQFREQEIEKKAAQDGITIQEREKELIKHYNCDTLGEVFKKVCIEKYGFLEVDYESINVGDFR